LVFSCYNGYFDVPGELSMAEGMLRAKRKGVVAMLSATRLTYGHGNVVMNNLLFEGIFKDKLLRVGQATAVSKTRLLKQEGSVWLTQMYEYTLFGDPASRLNIPDYEAQIQPNSLSVSSGGKLEVGTAKVVNLQGQPSGISVNTSARLVLPNGNQETIPVSISNGNTPALSINIPSNATNGTGFLKLFGEIGSEAVIGGFKFNIGIPFIKSLDYEIKDGNLQIYAKIDDDSGNSKLKSVVISWNSGTGQNQSQMVYDQAKDAYKLQESINVSNSSRDVVYKIVVTDNDNNVVNTDQMVISLSSRTNLVVAQTELGNYPDIKYIYSAKEQKWGLVVGLLNSGRSSVSCPVDVMAFDGNPDANSDGKLDTNARLLGKASVQLGDWKTLEKGTQTANIFVPCTLTNGRQFVFVWIDPPNSDGISQCSEENKNDNLSSRILDIADVLLIANQEITIKDTNNAIQAIIPSNSVNQNKPLKINSVKDMKIQNNQPSISFVPLPNGQNAGFMLSDPLLETSEIFNFNKTVSIKILYEIAPIWNKIKNEIGLGNIPDNSLETEQIEVLNKTFIDRVSKMGIYRWYESAKRWAKLPSRPIYESGEIIRKNIYAFVIENDNNLGIISHLSLDNSANTPIDDWRINFVDSTHYNVEGTKTGRIKQNDQDYIGTVGNEFFDTKTGIRLKVTTGINPFIAGSQLRFKTVETGVIEADVKQLGIFCLMMNSDNRPPNIKIDVANQKFANGDIVSSEPEIHALISDDNGIDLLSRKIDILISLDGGDFESVKPEDYVYRWDNMSNDVALNYNPKKLESGSYEVKIMAYDFNGNLGIRSIRFDVKSDFKLEEKSLMNYPNPFERETDITFHISSVADDVIIKIYTVSGRLIRTLECHNVINFVMIHWDGRDEDGKEVANGVYYYKLRLKSRGKDDIVEIGKMLKLK
ncbi:TPA: hypothetical protein ENS27_12155, partial [bacterium]|nr:hypothetical protein [bacterium]